MKLRVRAIGIAPALLALTAHLSALSARPAHGAPPELFEFTPTPQRAPVSNPYVVDARSVRVRLDRLSALAPQARIVLNLFPNHTFSAVVERVDRRSAGRYTVAGALVGFPHSSFIIVIEQGVAAGLVEVPTLSLSFKLGYIADGVHIVSQIDSAKFPPCGNGANIQPRAGRRNASEEQAAPEPPSPPDDGVTGGCGPTQPVFDVMIVYTTAAKRAAGGGVAITAECQLAIETANQGYINSRVDARMRLVYRGEVVYDESGVFDDHLERITDPSDGSMDYVHSLRNAYKADLVSLWVNDSDNGDICGLAHCDVDEDEAFSVVNWACAVGNLSFHHEIGHNQGCAHDHDTCDGSCSCAAFDDSYGWRFFGNSGQGWRTVMAYDNDAGDYARINWFSNPNVGYDGQPTGVHDQAFNARTILVRRSHVESFRLSGFDVWVDFANIGFENGSYTWPFNTAAEGVNSIVNGVGASEEPTLWIKAGTTNETLTITKPMRVEACGGMVQIGG